MTRMAAIGSAARGRSHHVQHRRVFPPSRVSAVPARASPGQPPPPYPTRCVRVGSVQPHPTCQLVPVSICFARMHVTDADVSKRLIPLLEQMLLSAPCSVGMSSPSTASEPPSSSALPTIYWITLDLSENSLADEGLVALTTWWRDNLAILRLRTLKLYKNAISNGGAAGLARLIQLHEWPIEEVHLSHNAITDAGALQLLQAFTTTPYNSATQPPNSLSADDRHFVYPRFEPVRKVFLPVWMRLEYNFITDCDAVLNRVAQDYGSRDTVGTTTAIACFAERLGAPNMKDPNCSPKRCARATSALAPLFHLFSFSHQLVRTQQPTHSKTPLVSLPIPSTETATSSTSSRESVKTVDKTSAVKRPKPMTTVIIDGSAVFLMAELCQSSQNTQSPSASSPRVVKRRTDPTSCSSPTSPTTSHTSSMGGYADDSLPSAATSSPSIFTWRQLLQRYRNCPITSQSTAPQSLRILLTRSAESEAQLFANASQVSGAFNQAMSAYADPLISHYGIVLRVDDLTTASEDSNSPHSVANVAVTPDEADVARREFHLSSFVVRTLESALRLCHESNSEPSPTKLFITENAQVQAYHEWLVSKRRTPLPFAVISLTHFDDALQYLTNAPSLRSDPHTSPTTSSAPFSWLTQDVLRTALFSTEATCTVDQPHGTPRIDCKAKKHHSFQPKSPTTTSPTQEEDARLRDETATSDASPRGSVRARKDNDDAQICASSPLSQHQLRSGQVDTSSPDISVAAAAVTQSISSLSHMLHLMIRARRLLFPTSAENEQAIQLLESCVRCGNQLLCNWEGQVNPHQQSREGSSSSSTPEYFPNLVSKLNTLIQGVDPSSSTAAASSSSSTQQQNRFTFY